VAGASLVAAFAALSDALEPAGQEIFTAAILGFAAVTLRHVFWMVRDVNEMTS
jgi:hypothetical protein